MGTPVAGVSLDSDTDDGQAEVDDDGQAEVESASDIEAKKAAEARSAKWRAAKAKKDADREARAAKWRSAKAKQEAAKAAKWRAAKAKKDAAERAANQAERNAELNRYKRVACGQFLRMSDQDQFMMSLDTIYELETSGYDLTGVSERAWQAGLAAGCISGAAEGKKLMTLAYDIGRALQ